MPNTRTFSPVNSARPFGVHTQTLPRSIAEQALHGVRGQAFPLRVPGDAPVPHSNQAGVIGADPQAALLVFQQLRDPDVDHRHAVDFLDRREPDAVELHQRGLRAEPEVAIVGLHDRVDRGLRQSLLHLPDSMDVLGERSRRVERVGGLRNGTDDEQNAESSKCATHTIMIRARSSTDASRETYEPL